MARFILDVASFNEFGIMTDEEIMKISKTVVDVLNDKTLTNGIITMNCIDESNENQFNDELDIQLGKKTNFFTNEQLINFKAVCDE